MNIFQKFKEWRKRRYWSKRQLEFIKVMILTDYRWLGSNQIADELTSRYLKALSDDWYKISHEDISQFRLRIGLDPHKK